MDDERRSPIDDLASMFPGLDTAAASRMVAEVQRLGLDTARIVIERFSELAAQWPSGQWPSGASGDGPGAAPPRARAASTPGGPPSVVGGPQRQLQADAERAVDAYLNVVRRLYDVVAGFAMTPQGTTAGPGPEPLRLPPASPGGTTSVYAWLHNTTPSAATALFPRATDLVDHRDHHIPGESLTFDPAAVAQLDPGASRQLLATLRVPVDAVAGTYHGLVLVEHLPALALHVVAEVRPAAEEPARG
jgi:hypothetical protein